MSCEKIIEGRFLTFWISADCSACFRVRSLRGAAEGVDQGSDE